MKLVSRILASALIAALATHASFSFAQSQPSVNPAAQASSRAKPLSPPTAQRNAAGDRSPFPHYADKARGWFWKEQLDEKEPEPEAEEPPPPPPSPAPPPAPSGPKPFSSAWIKENLPKYMEVAMDDPSPQNVSNYLYLQRLAMDTADRFSSVYSRVATVDPALDENRARPLWGPAADLVAKQAERAKEAVIKEISQRYGLWFFFRSDCSPCHQQAPILHSFAALTGFTVLPVSVDGGNFSGNPFKRVFPDRGHAMQLGVSSTPSIFLVSKTGDFHAVADSVIPMDELIRRVVEIAASASAITDEQYASTRATSKNLMPSPKALDALAQSAAEDPNAVREYLKNQLTKKR